MSGPILFHIEISYSIILMRLVISRIEKNMSLRLYYLTINLESYNHISSLLQSHNHMFTNTVGYMFHIIENDSKIVMIYFFHGYLELYRIIFYHAYEFLTTGIFPNLERRLLIGSLIIWYTFSAWRIYPKKIHKNINFLHNAPHSLFSYYRSIFQNIHQHYVISKIKRKKE